MKKIYVTFALVCLILQVQAQNLNRPSYARKGEGNNIAGHDGNGFGNAAKSTGGGSRWYKPFKVIDDLTGNNMNMSGQFAPMWFDSTIRDVYFGVGAAIVNFSSMAQVIAPVSNESLYNSSQYDGRIKVTMNDVYHVDSVSISGSYLESNTRPANVVDTFIISVAPSQYALYWPKVTNPWAATYIPAQDTIWGFVPALVDSINRAAFSDDASAQRAIWKVPLTDAMRDPFVNLQEYKFEVPNGGLNIPAGYRAAITFTFKSGDSWIPNVDTIGNFHHFLVQTGEPTGGGLMPYTYYQYGDKNGSALMLSNDPSFYYPTFTLEAATGTAFPHEFINIGASISCSSCATLGIPSVRNEKPVTVYPNPAADQLSITVPSEIQGDFTLSLTNISGQVVLEQNINANTYRSTPLTISTKDLSTGIYSLTLKSGTTTFHQKLAITH